MFWMVTTMSCWRGSSFSSLSFYSSSSYVAGLVDLTPWCWPCMWPFWVSSDSGKNLFKFLMSTRGQKRYFPFQMALRHVRFEGKPADPWRYWIAVSMLGSSFMWCITSFCVGRSCMKMERFSSMAMVRRISYNELRECCLSGLSISRVSVLKILTCDVKGMHHSVDCGHRHPFNIASSGTLI